MKYCQIVQDVAARDYNWSYYDKNVRFLRQMQASQVTWVTVHWELWHFEIGFAKIFKIKFYISH